MQATNYLHARHFNGVCKTHLFTFLKSRKRKIETTPNLDPIASRDKNRKHLTFDTLISQVLTQFVTLMTDYH